MKPETIRQTLLVLQVILLGQGADAAFFGTRALKLGSGREDHQDELPRNWDADDDRDGPTIVLRGDLFERRHPGIIQVPLLLKYEYDDYPGDSAISDDVQDRSDDYITEDSVDIHQQYSPMINFKQSHPLKPADVQLHNSKFEADYSDQDAPHYPIPTIDVILPRPLSHEHPFYHNYPSKKGPIRHRRFDEGGSDDYVSSKAVRFERLRNGMQYKSRQQSKQYEENEPTVDEAVNIVDMGSEENSSDKEHLREENIKNSLASRKEQKYRESSQHNPIKNYRSSVSKFNQYVPTRGNHPYQQLYTIRDLGRHVNAYPSFSSYQAGRFNPWTSSRNIPKDHVKDEVNQENTDHLRIKLTDKIYEDPFRSDRLPEGRRYRRKNEVRNYLVSEDLRYDNYDEDEHRRRQYFPINGNKDPILGNGPSLGGNSKQYGAYDSNVQQKDKETLQPSDKTPGADPLEKSEVENVKSKLGIVHELMNLFRILRQHFIVLNRQFLLHRAPELHSYLKKYIFEEYDIIKSSDNTKMMSDQEILLLVAKCKSLLKIFLSNARYLTSTDVPSIIPEHEDSIITPGEAFEASKALHNVIENVGGSMEAVRNLSHKVEEVLAVVIPRPFNISQFFHQAVSYCKDMIYQYVPSIKDIHKNVKQYGSEDKVNEEVFLFQTLFQHRLLATLLQHKLQILISFVEKSLPFRLITDSPQTFSRSLVHRFISEKENDGTGGENILSKNLIEPQEGYIKKFSDNSAEYFAKYVAQQADLSFRNDVHYLFTYPFAILKGHNEEGMDNILRSIMERKAMDIIRKLKLKSLLRSTGIKDDKFGISYNYAIKKASNAILQASLPFALESAKRTLMDEAVELTSDEKCNVSLNESRNSSTLAPNEDYDDDDTEYNGYFRRAGVEFIQNTLTNSEMLNQYKPLYVKPIISGIEVGEEKVNIYSDILQPALRALRYLDLRITGHNTTGDSDTLRSRGKSNTFLYITAKLIQDLADNEMFTLESDSLDYETKLALLLTHFYLRKRAEDYKERLHHSVGKRMLSQYVNGTISHLDVDASPPPVESVFTGSSLAKNKYDGHPRHQRKV